MAKGEIQTKPTGESVDKFVDGIADEKKRAECRLLLGIMKEATGAQPQMWGPSIVGFGSYQYEAAGGRMNDFFVAGFSPRKQNLTIYLSSGYGKYADLMKKLGKHTTGASCLYIKSLNDIDQVVLRELIVKGVKDMPKRITKADRISTRGS
jgi:Domain of unknown function (DU1801)